MLKLFDGSIQIISRLKDRLNCPKADVAESNFSDPVTLSVRKLNGSLWQGVQ